jgi:hypothetical protein
LVLSKFLRLQQDKQINKSSHKRIKNSETKKTYAYLGESEHTDAFSRSSAAFLRDDLYSLEYGTIKRSSEVLIWSDPSDCVNDGEDRESCRCMTVKNPVASFCSLSVSLLFQSSNSYRHRKHMQK